MSSSPRLVGGQEGGSETVSTRLAVSRMLLVTGCAFAFVGFADLVLLWFPPHPGNVAWEYATVGRTLDSMPMPTLGLLLIGYGVLRRPRPTRTGVALVAAIFLVLAVMCAFFAFLVFTAAPAVLSQASPEAAEAVRRAATRHGVQGIVYPLAWLAVAAIVWKARATEGLA